MYSPFASASIIIWRFTSNTELPMDEFVEPLSNAIFEMPWITLGTFSF